MTRPEVELNQMTEQAAIQTRLIRQLIFMQELENLSRFYFYLMDQVLHIETHGQKPVL